MNPRKHSKDTEDRLAAGGGGTEESVQVTGQNSVRHPVLGCLVGSCLGPSGFSQKTSIVGSDVPTMVLAEWHERSCNRVAERFDRSEVVSPTPPQLHVDSARELSLK